MRKDRVIDSLGRIDDDMIQNVEVLRQKKKRPAWTKWAAVAACLAVAVIAGVSLLPGNNTVQTSVGGIMREYKNASVASSEEAIVWPWEYKTEYERYSTVFYDGKEYTVKTLGLAVDAKLLGEKLGSGEGIGYDEYTEKEYRQSLDVWCINGISPELMVAAELDGQFYTYKYAEFVPPTTLGAVMDDYSLSQTLTLGRFAVQEDGQETGYYALTDDDYIWQVLSGCRDAQFVEDDAGGRISKNRITFTATSEALGVYKRAFYVSEDGYVSTNVFDWRYAFYIGEDAAADIISYAKKNSTEAEREPYTYALSGTLIEIGDEYILVDDSILCADEKDGMVFKVLTSDLRISRCIDYQKIEVGSIVVISFTGPIDVEAENVVTGAVSMVKGYLYEDGVAVPE